jgi:hypothetical protein
VELGGLPVTRPSRIAADLLRDREDPEAVAQLVVDALRGVYDEPRAFVASLAAHAVGFGLRRGDGLALLGWLLALVGDRDSERWMQDAREALVRGAPAVEQNGWSRAGVAALGAR